MPGRLGVDFGTSNTVLAVWDRPAAKACLCPLPEYSRTIRYRQGGQAAEEIAVIPSLIHYAADNRRWLGQQVVTRNLSRIGTNLPLDEAIHRPPQSRPSQVDGRAISAL